MAFVKLDCGILNSTLWVEKDARDVFITALLMAQPREFEQPTPQLEPDSLNETGWSVPPGWYGFVPAAGVGIIRMTGIPTDVGIEALRKLGSPEPDSRSQEFEGRRLVRVNGGYLVLNFMRYREKDHTAAERMRRLRARKRDASQAAVTPVALRHVTPSDARVTDSRGQRTEDRVHTTEVRKEGTEPPALPPADKTERSIRQRTDALRTRLYALVDEAKELDPKRRDPTELMRLFTSYNKNGNQVGGVVNAGLLSFERLEKSIADAEGQIEEWKHGQGQQPAV